MNLPEVGGRKLETPLADFERSCLVHIREIQEETNPDTALIALLCNAVWLARECADYPPMLDISRDEEPVKNELRQLVEVVNKHRVKDDDGGLRDFCGSPWHPAVVGDVTQAALTLVLAYEGKKPDTARVAHDEIPALNTLNTSEPTPPDVFRERVARAIEHGG